MAAEIQMAASPRYPFLDNLRGITLTSMILYHAVWDLVYIFGVPWDWFGSFGAYLWQQSICWTFILLSGFCQGLARSGEAASKDAVRSLRAAKNGLTIFGAGLLVTAVTLAFMPAERVVLGVLTLIGSCMLLLVPLRKVLDRIHPAIGLMIAFLLFALFKGVNGGWLGFLDIPLFHLPGWLYADLCTTYLGFPTADFYSTDYFSLLPWFFLFLTGYFLCRFLSRKGKLRLPAQRPLPLFAFMGRHSLVIYLLHQPIVYGALVCGSVFFAF
ncbi:MAG: DUF1624 domain-containing protein [Lachnospiraceae bacterium]|nr:DUF1624 domain-containing protein [Lachnospiraceae bacterium]